MSEIVVIGGTGYAGSHIVAEAVARGHQVVAVSRKSPEHPIEGVTYRALDVRDADQLKSIIEGADVVVSALSPRGDMADDSLFRGTVRAIAQAARRFDVRFGVIGGAGSLLIAPGGPKVVDAPGFAPEYEAEARTLSAVLDDLRAEPGGLDWFLVSPPAIFGAFVPGERRGTYRVGGDVLLSDAEGKSHISGTDLALAVVDEIEGPAHHRERFTVAY